MPLDQSWLAFSPTFSAYLRVRLAAIISAAVAILIITCPYPSSEALASAEQRSVEVRPAKAGEVWLKYHMRPGSTRSGELLVDNDSGKRQRLKLYAVDARLERSSGAFVLESETTTRWGVGAWIQLPRREIVLAANSQRRLHFRIEVPRAMKPGRYSGGIIFEAPPTVTKVGNSKRQVLVIQRVGQRIYLTVTGRRKSRFVMPSWVAVMISALALITVAVLLRRRQRRSR